MTTLDCAGGRAGRARRPCRARRPWPSTRRFPTIRRCRRSPSTRRRRRCRSRRCRSIRRSPSSRRCPALPPLPVVTLATQTLFAQCSVEPQAVPQPPQFAPLLVVSRQLVPHSVCPIPHSVVHVPLLQTWPDWQVFEQLPQCVASDATQEPLQSISPDWHWHDPPWQTCVLEQGMPQAPQFMGSDEVSMQSVPQAVCAPGQVLPPVPGLPPVPVVPPSPFEQASARNARPRAKIRTRAVVILTPIPDGAESDRGPASPRSFRARAD